MGAPLTSALSQQTGHTTRDIYSPKLVHYKLSPSILLLMFGGEEHCESRASCPRTQKRAQSGSKPRSLESRPRKCSVHKKDLSLAVSQDISQNLEATIRPTLIVESRKSAVNTKGKFTFYYQYLNSPD